MNQQLRITPETITNISLILGFLTGSLLASRADDLLRTLERGTGYAETTMSLVISGITFVLSVFLWRKRGKWNKTLARESGLAFVASTLFWGAIWLAMYSLLNLLTFRPDPGLSIQGMLRQ